jgi:hypothetical protein
MFFFLPSASRKVRKKTMNDEAYNAIESSYVYFVIPKENTEGNLKKKDFCPINSLVLPKN